MHALSVVQQIEFHHRFRRRRLRRPDEKIDAEIVLWHIHMLADTIGFVVFRNSPTRCDGIDEIAQLALPSCIGILFGFQEVVSCSLPCILNRPCQSISSMHFRRRSFRCFSGLLLLKVASFWDEWRAVWRCVCLVW